VRTMAVLEAFMVIVERWMNAGVDFDEREQQIGLQKMEGKASAI
jgi:hypothetical protein